MKLRKKHKEKEVLPQIPKIPKRIKPLRNFGVFVGLNKFEKRKLRQMSKKVGLSMSAFIREAIFKKFLDSIKIQIIGSGRAGIERIRASREPHPLQAQMIKGFADCIKEIKRGFKEQRDFLKPIPNNELKEIQERKTERLKELGIEL